VTYVTPLLPRLYQSLLYTIIILAYTYLLTPSDNVPVLTKLSIEPAPLVQHSIVIVFANSIL